MKSRWDFIAVLATLVALNTASAALAQFPDQWTKDPANPISTDFGGSTILFHEGIYKGWGGMSGFYYATSPDGHVWTRQSGDPVLVPGPDWYDEMEVANASVVIVDGTYHMYYSCIAADDDNRIAHATSVDGIAWTKDPANPVMDLGPPGSLDSGEVMHPCVIYEAPHYRMWYNGVEDAPGDTPQRILQATSNDGLSWIRFQGAALEPEWDTFLGMMNVVFYGGVYYMFYTAGIEIQGSGALENVGIGYATSPNGHDWTKRSPSAPVLVAGEPGSWDALAVIGPVVMATDTEFMMWYGGTTDMQNFSWGLATAAFPPSPVPDADGILLGQNFPNPFNPSTTIHFTIEEQARAELAVFDAAGAHVRQLINGRTMSQGVHQIPWNGRDDLGHGVPAGVYFYRLKVGNFSETRRMVLIK